MSSQFLGRGFEFFEPYTNQLAEIMNFKIEDNDNILVVFKVIVDEPGLTITGTCKIVIDTNNIKFVKIGEKI